MQRRPVQPDGGDGPRRLPQAGGGVVIFGGDQVVAENYNRLLYADGKGLLPAAIGPSVGDAAKKAGGLLLQSAGLPPPDHFGIPGQSDPVTAGITQAITWQYHKLVLAKDTKAEIAMAFDTGDPAVVEMPRHRGTVILVATSADMGWTTWPRAQELSAGHAADRDASLGGPVRRAEHPRRPAVRSVVSRGRGRGAGDGGCRPRGQPVSTKLQPGGGVSQFHFEQTDLAGAVSGEDRAAAVARIVVRRQPRSGRERSDQAGPRGPGRRDSGLEFSLPDELERAGQDVGSVGRRGELHQPLLYGLLALLLVESLLAWRFGHHDVS